MTTAASGTTTKGTVYTGTGPFVPSGTTESAMYHVPANVPATGVTLVLYVHGAGGEEDEQLLDNNVEAFYGCIDEGWIVAGSEAGHVDLAIDDNNWGNDLGRTAYQALVTHLLGLYDITSIVVWCRSMGGLCGSYAATQDEVIAPLTKAVAFDCSVLNLRSAYDEDVGSQQTKIKNAYGIAADGSDYTVLTAGHDPNLYDPTVWDGNTCRHYRFYYVTSDANVPHTHNALLVQPKVAARNVQEADAVNLGNYAHNDPQSYDIAPDVISFFRRGIAGRTLRTTRGGPTATTAARRAS